MCQGKVRALPPIFGMISTNAPIWFGSRIYAFPLVCPNGFVDSFVIMVGNKATRLSKFTWLPYNTIPYKVKWASCCVMANYTCLYSLPGLYGTPSPETPLHVSSMACYKAVFEIIRGSFRIAPFSLNTVFYGWRILSSMEVGHSGMKFQKSSFVLLMLWTGLHQRRNPLL